MCVYIYIYVCAHTLSLPDITIYPPIVYSTAYLVYMHTKWSASIPWIKKYKTVLGTRTTSGTLDYIRY